MNIIDYFNGKMNTPNFYGSFNSSWFHYLAILLIIIFSYLFLKSLKNINSKDLNKKILTFSIILIVFEIYKQIIFLYNNNWEYQWYVFPFQFCSVPIYVSLLAYFVKNEKIKESLINFLATFSLFAGLAVIIYPGDVFTEIIGINVQTMVHHGSMVILGIGLLVYKVNLKWISMLRGIIVFVIILGIASLLNFLFNTYIHNGTFNMFFINPKMENHLPILSLIQPKVHPFIFVVIYAVGFSGIASLIFLIRKAFDKKPSLI